MLSTWRVASNPAVEAALGEFSRRLHAHFGGRIVGLILFGSYARGNAGPDSDVDVAVVLDRVDSHAERGWPMGLSGELEGPLLVPIVLSKAELEFLRAKEDRLAENIDREGVDLLPIVAQRASSKARQRRHSVIHVPAGWVIHAPACGPLCVSAGAGGRGSIFSISRWTVFRAIVVPWSRLREKLAFAAQRSSADARSP